MRVDVTCASMTQTLLRVNTTGTSKEAPLINELEYGFEVSYFQALSWN